MPETGKLLFLKKADDSSVHESNAISTSDEPPWKIMVIDDDEDIHSLTKMVLKQYKSDNRSVEFIDGYSGKDARRLIQEHPDTAIIFLDVVMETDKVRFGCR